jgi:uncharacterized Fe-S cluster-containing radical SAM superfamily protein
MKNTSQKSRSSSQKLITEFFDLPSKDEGSNKEPFPNLGQPVNENRIKGFNGNDPIKLAEFLRKKVCKDNSRKYYRFRGGRFYGGIAAADCVGCVLDCVYCWSYKPRCDPDKAGEFYSARQVVDKLMEIADKNKYSKLRITGNEPTLCKDHLIEVLEYVPEHILFILETNGILLDKKFVKELVRFSSHLHVRVSLKGIIEEQFERITAMAGEYVEYPFNALKHLTNAEISCNAAIMKELLEPQNVEVLVNKLKSIDPRLAQELEIEELMIYPFIKSELSRRKLDKNFKPE